MKKTPSFVTLPFAYAFHIKTTEKAEGGYDFTSSHTLSSVAYLPIRHIERTSIERAATFCGEGFGQAGGGPGEILHNADTGEFYCRHLAGAPRDLCGLTEFIFANAARQIGADDQAPNHHALYKTNLRKALSKQESHGMLHLFATKPSYQIERNTRDGVLADMRYQAEMLCIIGEELAIPIYPPRLLVVPDREEAPLALDLNYPHTKHGQEVSLPYNEYLFSLADFDKAVSFIRESRPDWQPDFKVALLRPELFSHPANDKVFA